MRIFVANTRVRAYRRMFGMTGFMTIMPWGQMASRAPARLKNAGVRMA